MTSALADRNKAFLKALRHEIQNRAFALTALRPLLSKYSAPEDVAFFKAWIAFEEYNQRRYAPYAEKYRISQTAGWSARLRAGMANRAAALLSERVVLNFMLKETKNHVSKLAAMAELGPQEDKSFLSYVVKQERLQVELLELRIKGETRKATTLLTCFVSEHA